MGFLIDDKTYENVSKTERWCFHMSVWTGPHEVSVQITRQEREPGGKWRNPKDDKVYRRTFPGDEFHDRHYVNFRKKFVRDKRYRERFLHKE